MYEGNLKSLENYPELILIKIVSFLSVKDRLKVKSISKYFKFLVEKFFPLKSLCIYEDAYPFGVKWPFSEEKIKEQEKVYVASKLTSKSINLNNECFKKLEKLYVYKGKNFQKEISCFRSEKLKILAVNGPFDMKFHDDQGLLFKNLNVLLLENVNYRYPFSFLDVPNLKKLSILNSSWRVVDLKNPKELESLKCVEFNLDKFGLHVNGLKKLICQDIIFPFSLNDLPSLEYLEIYPSKNYQEIIELFKGINRKNLEIYLYGLNIKNRDIFKLLNSNLPLVFDKRFFDENPIILTTPFLKDIVANNYSEIKKPFHWPCKLFYSNLTESFTSPPENFQKLFPFIKELSITDVANHFNLTQFLKGCSYLERLILRGNCLDQKFLDENIHLLTNLRWLHIYEYTIKINFRFISKLRFLKVLYIWDHFSLDGFKEMENWGCNTEIIFGPYHFWIAKKDDMYVLKGLSEIYSSKNVGELLYRMANEEKSKKYLI